MRVTGPAVARHELSFGSGSGVKAVDFGLSTTRCLTLCQDSLVDRVSDRRHTASMANFETAVFDRRYGLLYFTAWLAGLVLALTELSPRLTGFGLGLMVPGGGLAFYGHWAEAAIALAGVGFLIAMRRTALAVLIWLVVATAPLTHDPHHGYMWMAGLWIVPALSGLCGATAIAIAAARPR